MRIAVATVLGLAGVITASSAFAQEHTDTIVGSGRTRVLPIARDYESDMVPATHVPIGTPQVAMAYDDAPVVVSSASNVPRVAAATLPSRYLPIARDFELPVTVGRVNAGPPQLATQITDVRPATQHATVVPAATVTGTGPQLAPNDVDSGAILPRMTVLPEYDDRNAGPPVVITVQPLRGPNGATRTGNGRP